VAHPGEAAACGHGDGQVDDVHVQGVGGGQGGRVLPDFPLGDPAGIAPELHHHPLAVDVRGKVEHPGFEMYTS
jgi:hypothetical protein